MPIGAIDHQKLIKGGIHHVKQGHHDHKAKADREEKRDVQRRKDPQKCKCPTPQQINVVIFKKDRVDDFREKARNGLKEKNHGQ